MPILKMPPKQSKNAMIQVRVDEDIKRNLDKYAQFIEANQAYVVSEALKFLFRKDAEFRAWLDMHAQAENGQSVNSAVLARSR